MLNKQMSHRKKIVNKLVIIMLLMNVKKVNIELSFYLKITATIPLDESYHDDLLNGACNYYQLFGKILIIFFK